MSEILVPFWVGQYRRIKQFIIRQMVNRLSYFRFIRETRNYKQPIFFDIWYHQKVLGYNSATYWPVHHTTRVTNYRNVYVGVECFPGYMPGCYIQAIGKVYIDDYTIVSANVGIISANHDLYDARKHTTGDVHIGKYCWLGMNVMVMPGVTLGDNTIVAAGSVVTKSFPEGHCVIGGVPAKVIKYLEKEKCVKYEINPKYHGYIRAEDFEAYRKKELNV